MRTFGDHIRKRWLDLKLLQKDVAEQMGTDTATVTNWENNHTTPATRFSPAIARFLGYWLGETARTLPERLRQTRVRLGMSQADFGAKIGFNEESISGWEGGWRKPSKWTAGRLHITLELLEREISGSGSVAGGPGAELDPVEAKPTSYFDLTRHRRRLPADNLPASFGSLGDRIRFRRLEQGLTQEQLAEQLGLGRMRVLRWECGACRPAERLMPCILKFLAEDDIPSGPRRETADGEKYP